MASAPTPNNMVVTESHSHQTGGPPHLIHNTLPSKMNELSDYDVPIIEEAMRICERSSHHDRNSLYACYTKQVSERCESLSVTYELISLKTIMTLIDFDYKEEALVMKPGCPNRKLANILLKLNDLLDASMPNQPGCASVGVNVQGSIGSLILWCTAPTDAEIKWYKDHLEQLEDKLNGPTKDLRRHSNHNERQESRQKHVASVRTSARNNDQTETNTYKIKLYSSALKEAELRRAMTEDERVDYMNLNKLVLVWNKENDDKSDDTAQSGRNVRRKVDSPLPNTASKLVGAMTTCRFVSSSLHTTSVDDIGIETHSKLKPYFDGRYYYIDVMCSRKKGVGTLLVCIAVLLALDRECNMSGIIALSFRMTPIKNDDIPQSLPVFLKCDFRITIPLVAYPEKQYYGVWLVRTFESSLPPPPPPPP